MRIVSLISSATEILCALGLEKELVGISHECDFPPSITHLPRLSEPKLDVTRASGEIDRNVRELVRDGLSIYAIKTDLLAALKPDLILTQDQCDVCAVSLKDVEAAVCTLTLGNTRICSLRPHTLDDILEDFRRVGRATGTLPKAESLVSRFRDRLDAVARRAPRAGRPRVLILEWLDPLIVAGGWMPEIARIAGGDPLVVTGPEPFKKITWEEARAARADVVVVMPCGYPLGKTAEELTIGEAGRALAALPAGAIHLADGNSYFNRPGPRIADSAEILAALFHPVPFADFRVTYRQAARSWPAEEKRK